MSKYSVIHLSDIHLIEGWYEEQGRIFEELIDDIKVQIKDSHEVVLVITGDLVMAGDDAGSYDEFERIFHAKLEEVGINSSKRIVIPGNHEVQRGVVEGNWGIIDAIQGKKESLTDFQNNVTSSYSSILSEKFENFQLFSSTFTDHSMNNDTYTGYPVNYAPDLQFYCLNSAVTSYAGAKGKRDERLLRVDIRTIEKWLQAQRETESAPIRVLLSHHPIEDLQPEYGEALQSIIRRSFDIVLTGHRHDASGDHIYYEHGEHTQISAPALFSGGNIDLGYSIIHLDREAASIIIQYRQLSKNKKFVSGTSLSDSDDGYRRINLKKKVGSRLSGISNPDTLRILEAKLNSSIQTSPGEVPNWVEPILCDLPEFENGPHSPVKYSVQQAIELTGNLVIKAPPQFGLTSLASRLSYVAYRDYGARKYLSIDASECPNDSVAIKKYVDAKSAEYGWCSQDVDGIIIDNYSPSMLGSKRKAKELSKAFPSIRIIIMLSVDDASSVGHNHSYIDESFDLYLWTLSRSQVRKIVRSALGENQHIKEESVLNRVVEDLRDLNLHRTPLNCIALAKIAISQMDRSPVNRTELIEQFLGILFKEYHTYSKYSTIPDQKDAQYALAPICKDIILSGVYCFTKEEFFKKTSDYCSDKLIDIEIDVLFACLVNSNILIKKNGKYEFRFTYWIYYFAAHAMLQDDEFKTWMLSDRHYIKYPQVIEFYTGIDRHRDDIIVSLKEDLDELLKGFEERTGFDPNFFILDYARINPSNEQIDHLHGRIEEEVQESDLPVEIKDKFADQDFDRTKPYNQKVHDFIEESFFGLTRVSMAASTALRNSEHVDGKLKAQLLSSIASSWNKIGQVMTIMSFELADTGYGSFENYSLKLDKIFYEMDEVHRWYQILASMPYNICLQTKDYIYSPKLLPLYKKMLRETDSGLFKDLLIKHIIYNRPKNWREMVATYLKSLPNKSIYYYSVFATLREEKRYAIMNEQDEEDAKQLIKYCGSFFKAK